MRILLALAGLLVGSSVVTAQQPADALFNDEREVRRILTFALDKIQLARCERAQPCAPATAAEKANPPITIAEARVVIRRAVLSATAEHCGLDWHRRNFEPMMAYWRTTKTKNERQVALIVLMHGLVQGFSRQKAVEKGPCSEQDRRNLEANLSFRP
jgi:hypothetical protein